MFELLLIVGGVCLLGLTVTHAISVSGGGMVIQPQPVIRTGSGLITLEEPLPTTEAGSLTTRTSDSVGTITMTEALHTIATGNTIDIYWSGGVRYAVTVGTVSTTSVPISGGSGDVLPAAATAVTVVVPKSANITIDGDNAKIIAIELSSTTKSLRTAGHIQLVDASAAEVAEIDLVTNVPQTWDIEGGSANPFTGAIITAAKLSQAEAAAGETYTLKILGVQDATP